MIRRKPMLNLFASGFVVLAASAPALGQRPDRRPPGPPPPEALEACDGKTDGDECAFEGRFGSVTGTCFRPEASLPLACRPDHPPPPDQQP